MLHDIPGGEALIEWFGRVPSFYLAELLEITFSSKGAGLLRIHAWDMPDEMDAKGSVVLDKHALVTVTLEGVSTINCADFDMVPAIIFDLEITKVDEHFRLEWSASYGVAGFVTAKHVEINLVPVEAD